MKKFGRFIKNYVGYITFLLIYAVMITFVFIPGHTSGESMEPSIHDGDYTITNHLAYKHSTPKRGDCVIIYTGFEGEEYYLKRVIGEPGDRVSFKKGNVYINGKKIDEPYLSKGTKTYPDDGLNEYILNENEVFCMGDNREVSMDSRSDILGPIPVEDIEGKVDIRFKPFKEIERL